MHARTEGSIWIALTRAGAARIAADLLGGALLYVATGLTPQWWAAWLAPIPLLIVAFRSSKRETWALALLAGLIGGAATGNYLGMLIGPMAAVVVTLRAVALGFVVTQTRSAVLRSRHWSVAFLYPALWVALETLVAIPRDGDTF